MCLQQSQIRIRLNFHTKNEQLYSSYTFFEIRIKKKSEIGSELGRNCFSLRKQLTTHAAFASILCSVTGANCYSADFIRSIKRSPAASERALCGKWPKIQAPVISLFTKKGETEKLSGVQ